jgi:uncharacterized membrane protein
MNSSLVLALAFCIGIVAGLRSLTAPAVVSCAAHLGWINLHGTRLSFMGTATAALFFTLFALVELTTDKWERFPARFCASREANHSLWARFSAQSVQLREHLADIRRATESSPARVCLTSRSR